MFQIDCGVTLEDVKREFIFYKLRCCNGNRMKTAKMLGISLRGLRHLMTRYESQGHNIPNYEFRHQDILYHPTWKDQT